MNEIWNFVAVMYTICKILNATKNRLINKFMQKFTTVQFCEQLWQATIGQFYRNLQRHMHRRKQSELRLNPFIRLVGFFQVQSVWKFCSWYKFFRLQYTASERWINKVYFLILYCIVYTYILWRRLTLFQIHLHPLDILWTMRLLEVRCSSVP